MATISRAWMRSCATLACLALILSACGEPELHGTTLVPPSAAPDFSLTDSSGAPFRLSDLRGRVVLLYFGFTSCPDVCPTTLASVARALDRLGATPEDVTLAMVTTDPERDTPRRLSGYMTGFDPDFVGLLGSEDELRAVYDAYGVTVERQPLPDSALGYTIDHTASLFVIDRAGMLREFFLFGADVDDIVADLAHFTGLEPPG